MMTSLFSHHRLQSNSIYIGKNFGMISIIDPDDAHHEETQDPNEADKIHLNESDIGYCNSKWIRKKKYLKVSIQSIDGIGSRKSLLASTNHSTQEVLSFNRTITSSLGLHHHCLKQFPLERIVSIDYPDFFSFPPYLSLGIISLLLYIVIWIMRFVFRMKKTC
mmetsp:Transcript_8059/g.11332  ORF Transcript_8059/g.11332 Transcript_8059/m.11332 type:complete len:163 (+) Transcript_8059:790-1278(+)